VSGPPPLLKGPLTCFGHPGGTCAESDRRREGCADRIYRTGFSMLRIAITAPVFRVVGTAQVFRSG
jgi:hypothetical protein